MMLSSSASLQQLRPTATAAIRTEMHVGFLKTSWAWNNHFKHLAFPVLQTFPPSTRIFGRKFVEVRCTSALRETLRQDLEESTMTIDPENRGDNIRKRFLEFFQSRGHKILPSSSLVPEDPTVLLTIAGMLQFKPIFLGQIPRSVPRATTSQKCVRTNDVENVGVTARHHTFFEMLGNFSFGDYFKKQAVKWAWELATVEFKLPEERVFVSVFENDDEAFGLWRDEVGVSVERIKRMGAEDNFWASGPTGPCGPCSEMYYDFHPERGLEDADLNDDSRFIEFYNLVFMESNRLDDGSLVGLANKNIDTGLGLERMAQILQKVPNNYETDLIYPIVDYAAKLAKIDYKSATEKEKTYLKVIGDHARAVTYLISDGVIPSNIGRGYVVRRLIRRLVRMGRSLGIRGDGKGDLEGAFLPGVAEVAVRMSSPIDPHVNENASKIYEELQREELRFVSTLERGEKLLEKLLADALAESNGHANGTTKPVLAGKDIFLLYDTFGFPNEITEEVARERGVGVDKEGFEAEMEVQRAQSQSAHNVVKLTVGDAMADLGTLRKSEFLGYELLRSKSSVIAILSKGSPLKEAHEGQDVELILERTPFYAESGGQIGDHGTISGVGEGEDQFVVRVTNVQKSGTGLILHIGVVEKGKVTLGAQVEAFVDGVKRRRAMAHHTATHLLQSALKKTLGNQVSQKGSLVAFDRLRFDFDLPRPMTEDELITVENLVNGWIGEAVDLDTQVMALADARRSGAIAMFGEKYDDEVRVVNVEGISKELCGGTHVRNTADIRGMKIITEQGIAAGVRRIEAVCGAAFIDHVNQRDLVVRQLNSLLKVKPEDLAGRVQSLQDELKSLNKEAVALRAELILAKVDSLVNESEIVGSGNVRVLVTSLGTADGDSLRVGAERLITKLGDPGAFVIGSKTPDGKVSLVAAFSKKVIAEGLQAGKFLGPIAKLTGGGGGGKPHFAQAGGKFPDKLDEALGTAKKQLIAALSKT